MEVQTAQMEENGKYLVVGFECGSIMVQDISQGTGILVKSYEHFAKSSINAITVKGNVFAASTNTEIYVVEIDQSKFKIIDFPTNEIYEIIDISFSNNMKQLAVGTEGNESHIQDIENKSLLKKYKFNDSVVSVVFNRDDTILFSATVKAVQIDQVKNDVYYDRQVLNGHSGLVTDIKLSNNGKIVQTAGLDGYVLIWDLKNCAIINMIQVGKPIFNIAVKNDLVIQVASTNIDIIDIAQQKVVGSMSNETETVWAQVYL